MHFARTRNTMKCYNYKEASRRGVRVRILIDSDDPIEKMVRKVKEEKISIQHCNKPRQTKITILVLDNSYSLTVEMKTVQQTLLTRQSDWLLILTANQLYPLTFQYLKLFGYKVNYIKKKTRNYYQPKMTKPPNPLFSSKLCTTGRIVNLIQSLPSR